MFKKSFLIIMMLVLASCQEEIQEKEMNINTIKETIYNNPQLTNHIYNVREVKSEGLNILSITHDWLWCNAALRTCFLRIVVYEKSASLMHFLSTTKTKEGCKWMYKVEKINNKILLIKGIEDQCDILGENNYFIEAVKNELKKIINVW